MMFAARKQQMIERAKTLQTEIAQLELALGAAKQDLYRTAGAIELLTELEREAGAPAPSDASDAPRDGARRSRSMHTSQT